MRILVVLLLTLAGCAGAPSSPEATLEAELKAVYVGDADALLALHADPWLDFGGCVEISHADMRQNLEEWFDQEHTQEMERYNSHRELVDFTTMQRFDLADDEFFDCPQYEWQPGDVGLWAAPSEGSPLIDGWGGVYRHVDGRWLNIGGD